MTLTTPSVGNSLVVKLSNLQPTPGGPTTFDAYRPPLQRRI